MTEPVTSQISAAIIEEATFLAQFIFKVEQCFPGWWWQIRFNPLGGPEKVFFIMGPTLECADADVACLPYFDHGISECTRHYGSVIGLSQRLMNIFIPTARKVMQKLREARDNIPLAFLETTYSEKGLEVALNEEFRPTATKKAPFVRVHDKSQSEAMVVAIARLLNAMITDAQIDRFTIGSCPISADCSLYKNGEELASCDDQDRGHGVHHAILECLDITKTNK